MEKQKTASDIVVDALNDFCNNYCKYQDKFSDVDDDTIFDELTVKYCADCPINKII